MLKRMKFVFMKERDKQLIRYINKHYSELLEELKLAKNFDGFCSNKPVNKAIKLDLLQIGENFNHLTDESKLKLSKKDLSGIINVRNHVAHGYVTIEEETIWITIIEDLPRLIEQVNSIK